MKSYFEQVKEFHNATGLDIEDKPVWREDLIDLRMSLIEEEYWEIEEAVSNSNLVELADGLADLIYVACGMAVSFGIPLDEVFAEVQRSNMSKVAGMTKRKDGKILKGPGYSPPDIKRILEQ